MDQLNGFGCFAEFLSRSFFSRSLVENIFMSVGFDNAQTVEPVQQVVVVLEILFTSVGFPFNPVDTFDELIQFVQKFLVFDGVGGPSDGVGNRFALNIVE